MTITSLKSPKKGYHFKRVSFVNTDRTVINELREKVNGYFIHKNIHNTGNYSLHLKGTFFLISYIAGLTLVVSGIVPEYIALILCAYLGFAAAGIGFNLMHDGAHGSFSENKKINTIAAYCINLLGGDALLWKNKHNYIHHTYTNIEGHDQDIALSSVLRSNLLQKKYSFHKYQHLYCFLVYGLSSIIWIFFLDFQKYFQGKIGNIAIQSTTKKDRWIFWSTKVFYVNVYLIIPSMVWGWQTMLLGFMIYHIILGSTLSIVFQLAHVVEDTEFTEEHLTTNEINDEWAIHQLKTTANFSTKNSLVTWFTGGLNFQIEHHLFPKISHVHYPKINRFVIEICSKYKIPYHEYPNFFSAMKSHLIHLKKMGK